MSRREVCPCFLLSALPLSCVVIHPHSRRGPWGGNAPWGPRAEAGGTAIPFTTRCGEKRCGDSFTKRQKGAREATVTKKIENAHKSRPVLFLSNSPFCTVAIGQNRDFCSCCHREGEQVQSAQDPHSIFFRGGLTHLSPKMVKFSPFFAILNF